MLYYSYSITAPILSTVLAIVVLLVLRLRSADHGYVNEAYRHLRAGMSGIGKNKLILLQSILAIFVIQAAITFIRSQTQGAPWTQLNLQIQVWLDEISYWSIPLILAWVIPKIITRDDPEATRSAWRPYLQVLWRFIVLLLAEYAVLTLAQTIIFQLTAQFGNGATNSAIVGLTDPFIELLSILVFAAFAISVLKLPQIIRGKESIVIGGWANRFVFQLLFCYLVFNTALQMVEYLYWAAIIERQSLVPLLGVYGSSNLVPALLQDFLMDAVAISLMITALTGSIVSINASARSHVERASINPKVFS